MNLNPGDKAKVLRLVAEGLERDLRAAAGTVADLVLVPLAAAGAALCLPPSAVARRLPVVELGPRRRFVRLADLRTFLDQHTRQP